MNSTATVKLVYFSWLRERIGLNEEFLELPSTLATIDDLLDWLASRGESYAHALENKEVVRVALDQKHQHHSTELGDAREIALFPPMTGG